MGGQARGVFKRSLNCVLKGGRGGPEASAAWFELCLMGGRGGAGACERS